jgi:SAM-dependent methyltransferase
MESDTFDALIHEATEASMEGWDFSYLKGRKTEIQLPWDYAALVRKALAQGRSAIDLGTGGGEFLATLAPFRTKIYATEGYPPNLPIAQRRLGPLGVEVCDTTADPTNSHLPFADGQFDVIIDRHDEFVSAELFRILRPGGLFITQQCGGYGEKDLIEWFSGKDASDPMDWTAGVASRQLEESGFQITNVQEVYPEYAFLDVGAVVFDLRARPWNVDGFSVDRYRAQLLAMHEHISEHGRFIVNDQRFLVEAKKP